MRSIFRHSLRASAEIQELEIFLASLATAEQILTRKCKAKFCKRKKKRYISD